MPENFEREFFLYQLDPFALIVQNIFTERGLTDFFVCAIHIRSRVTLAKHSPSLEVHH